jgi:hypothetical protein
MNSWAVLKRDHTVTIQGDNVGTWRRIAWGYRFDCDCGARSENMYQQYLRQQIVRHIDSPGHTGVTS